MIKIFPTALATVAACLSASVLLHCGQDHLSGGSGAGNPPLAKVSVAFKANSTSPIAKTAGPLLRNPDGTLSILDSMGAVLTLTGIEARVRAVDVTLPESVTCLQILNLPCKDNEATLPGPYTVDLITGKSNSALSLFQLPPGTYKKLGIEFIRPDLGFDSTAQWDSSVQNIVIHGRLGKFSDPGKAFEVKLHLHDGLDFQDSIGIKIRTDTLNAIVMLLKADLWFKSVEMAKCLDSSQTVFDSAGIAQLNGDQSCNGRGLLIRKGIEASGELDEDDRFK